MLVNVSAEIEDIIEPVNEEDKYKYLRSLQARQNTLKLKVNQNFSFA
jgi:hypothetical protein